MKSAQAGGGVYKAAASLRERGVTEPVMSVNISGRGDEDVATAGRWFGYLTDDQSRALDANGAHGTSVEGE